MPHYQGHNPGPMRPKIRPKNVPEIFPKPKARPKNVPPKVAPMMGTRDPQGRIGVKGPKGGGEAAKARVEVGSDVFNQYNNDGRYGYYNDQGYYVPADIDMRDGGGADNADTFFEGGGFLSTLANIAKIRPYGQGDTPREQIGFRNVADMFDRGGPQHRDGPYRGGAMISALGNTFDAIGGVDQGTRTRYNYDTTQPTQSDGFVANIEPREEIPVRTIDGTPLNVAATKETANAAIDAGVEPKYRPNQRFFAPDRMAAITAIKKLGANFSDLSKTDQEDLIQRYLQAQFTQQVR